jgi:CubicO group peptidase (beta-lactamase class C family)
VNLKKKSGFLILVLFFTALSNLIYAQQKKGDKAIAGEAENYLNALTRQERFSGAVLISRSGKIVLNKGFGFANREFDVPVTKQTKFRLASVTKQFTAAAIMILQQQGRLKTGDLICKYIDDCPASWQAVTIRHLLNHTSGITEFGKPPQPANDDFKRKPMTRAEVLARAKTFTPDFAPGEKFAYSSQGFLLLGIIIEKASGKTYEDFLKENIFQPLKLENTGLDNQKTIIKNRASGYARAKDGSLTNFDYFNLDYLFSAGGLYSTVEDLYLWEQSFYTEKLLNQKSREEMLTAGLENTGYGWEIFQKFNRRLNRIDGRSFGFSNSMVSYPEEKVVIIVLSNIDTSGAVKIADDLSAIVFGEKYDNPAQNK